MQTEIQIQKPVEQEEPQLLKMQDEIEIVEDDLTGFDGKNNSQSNLQVEEQEIVVQEIKSEPEKLVIA